MKPAIEKLPLIARKNIRDSWESKKPGFEERLSTLLGQAWTITFDPGLIYANCQREDLRDRLGDVVSWYIEPLASNMEKWLNTFGEDGKSELNSICSAHSIELHPQETTEFTYGGFDVKDGVLRLVFAADNFATNVDDVSLPQALTDALKVASDGGAAGAKKGPIPLRGRMSIRDGWDAKVDALQQRIARLTGIPDIKLLPNFEANAEALKIIAPTAKYGYSQSDVENNLNSIGNTTYTYFNEMAEYLERTGFGGDDMLQEGFQDAATERAIGIRVVDKHEKKMWNEVVIKDGIVWMQCTANMWRTNVDQIADELLGIL